MKRIVGMLLLLVLLTGCAGENDRLDRAMALRAKMLAQAVSFDAEVTADFGDKTYTFAMHCQTDTEGGLTFSVTKPETLSSVTGTVAASGGKLTFDDVALAFPLMADGQVTPVSAPWILVKTLRSGYLTSCAEENGLLRVAIDDSYEEDALHLDIWLDSSELPVQAEIYWQGSKLLSLAVSNFTFL